MEVEYKWHDIKRQSPYAYMDVLLVDDCNKFWIGRYTDRWYVYEGEASYEITEFTQKFIAWTNLPIFSEDMLLSDNDKKRLEKFRELAAAIGDEPKEVIVHEDGSINIPKKLAAAIQKFAEEKDLLTIDIDEV